MIIDTEKYRKLIKHMREEAQDYRSGKTLGRAFVDAEDVLDEAADAIGDLLAALTPPNEWVSVENALPPEHESVLCIVSGKPKPNITLEDAYQLGSWNKADGWIIDEWPDWEGANVTWWMKLPEPPDRRPPEVQS